MTEPDEETKEHPAYGLPDASASTPSIQPQPPTTINTIPPAPPGVAPINPAVPSGPAAYPQTPAYPQPPPSGWPGQSQWQQPAPPPAYGQPTYGQPAYGTAAGYGAAQPWAGTATSYKTSFLVVLAGLVLIIFGVAVAVLGAWTLTLGSDLGRFIRDNDIAIFSRQIDRDTLKAVVQPMPGILMVLGLLQLVVGAVVLAHRNWARWLGVLLALLGLIVSVIVLSAVLTMVPGVSVQLIVAVALVIGYAFVLLALIAGGGHFRAMRSVAVR